MDISFYSPGADVESNVSFRIHAEGACVKRWRESKGWSDVDK